MRAIMVSVNYSDLLAITLPYHRHHFESVAIVTSSADEPNIRRIAEANDAQVIVTDLFYADGATFGKWQALEYGLDVYGRHGWLLLMDADVLWPKVIPEFALEVGKLYSPVRRMMVDLSQLHGPADVPCEKEWRKFPIHPNLAEHAGYSQLFHAADPHLGPPPWHETDWKHAGGADSFFQLRWQAADKIRPPFEALHLGKAGESWFGRASNYLDGTSPPDAEQKKAALRQLWRRRRERQSRGEDPYLEERLDPYADEKLS